MEPKQKKIVGTLTLTRDYFIKTMAQLEIQDRHDAKCIDAFNVILTEGSYVMGYNNGWVKNQLIDIIELAMNDIGKHTWIDYFIYDLDYGRNYKKGCVTDYGRNVPLKTSADLWDLLLSNINKREDASNSKEVLESLESVFGK